MHTIGGRGLTLVQMPRHKAKKHAEEQVRAHLGASAADSPPALPAERELGPDVLHAMACEPRLCRLSRCTTPGTSLTSTRLPSRALVMA